MGESGRIRNGSVQSLSHFRFGPSRGPSWLHAGVTALIALVAFRLLALTPGIVQDASHREWNVSLLAIAWGLSLNNFPWFARPMLPFP